MELKFWLALLVAMTATYALTPLVKVAAQKLGAVDEPEERKVHQTVMPRLGGVAIYLGFMLGVLLFLPFSRPVQGLLLGGTLVMALGVWDDLRGLSPRVKLAGQITAALVLVAFGVRVDYITNPLSGMIFMGKWAAPVTVLWVIGVTNALNLVDGLDGLAAGTTAIAAVTIGLVALADGQLLVMSLAILLAASVLGFIRYNFHPASIFMGDSGSMFLGFNLAALAIMGLTKGATVISLFIPVVILGIPLLDTTLAIVRRYLKRQPIFTPDRQHLHHRLLELGLSHRQAVLAIYGVNLCLGASAVLMNAMTTAQGGMLLIGLSLMGVLVANRLGVAGTRIRVRLPVRGRKSSVRDYFRG